MKYLQRLLLGLFTVSILAGCATTEVITNHNSSMIEFREADDVMEKAYVKMPIKGSDETIFVGDKVMSSSEDIKSMESGFGPQGMPQILVTLTEDGKSKFSEATKRLVKKYIAILINGEVIMAPFVQEQLETNRFVISGDLTIEEMDAIVSDFKPSK